MFKKTIPFSPAPLLILTFSLLLLIALLAFSPHAQATPRISPDQAIALALEGVEPVGENFRVSDMGGDVLYDAGYPSVAYNSTDNEYLVVWHGDDNSSGLVDTEYEIFGQRVDALTGSEIEEDFRISNMGSDGDPNYDANYPAVIYNPNENEYLVVWQGENNSNGLVDEEWEIYGQRVDGPSGDEIGGDFRISDMGPDGDWRFDAYDAAIDYNATNDEYLVVWRGQDNTGSLVEDEFEIFGQRVDASTGAEIGSNDFRLSDMGPNGDLNYDAYDPDVVYNPNGNEYLVVWYGDDNTAGLVDEEHEIFGQRVDAPSGAEIGGDFRISDMGPNGDPNYDAYDPAITYQPTENEYLVVWHGDDNTGGMVDDEREIFGQRLEGDSGVEIGMDFRISNIGQDGIPFLNAFDPALAYDTLNNEYLITWHGDDTDEYYQIYGQRMDASTGLEIGGDFRISGMGPEGDTYFDGSFVAMDYNPTNNEYLVVWHGDDNTGGLVDDEVEIFSQRLDATGTEIGADDFRISDMGGDVTFDGWHPKVAFNPTDNLYLVVWHGDDNTDALIDNENEIFGQMIDAQTGEEIGSNDFRISDMGPDGNLDYDALDPNVVYNPETNEFLVIWHGDDDTLPLVEDELEIFGQRLNAATGAEIGTNDFRISNMGPDGNALYDSYGWPGLVYNPTEEEYLVVWFGDAGTGSMIDNELEIFGQRLEGDSGAEIGGDFRISDMGGDGDISFTGGYAAVAYNATNNEYLVVWHGDDNVNGLSDEEYEIFGQRLNAATGAEIGANDFRISDMGDSSPTWGGFWPAIAYNPTDNEYLVVWNGDDSNGMADQEYEIFGQRLNAANGTELGTNDFRISDMGPDGDPNFEATSVSVAYISAENEYLVVWHGEDNVGGLIVNESEIFGQRLDAQSGTEIGPNDLRISFMAGTGVANYDAYYPALAYDALNAELLVVWSGDDHVNGLVDEEMETFGQRLDWVTQTPTPTPTPTITSTPIVTATPPPGPVYLPIAVRPIPCVSPFNEIEPNNTGSQATGPLCLNQNYLGDPNDGTGNWDYFYFTLNTPGTITIDVTNHPLESELGVQVLLYYQSTVSGNLIVNDLNPPYQIIHNALAGTYYIAIYNDVEKCNLVDCSQLYTLRVSFVSDVR